jgi:hypothetical protein
MISKPAAPLPETPVVAAAAAAAGSDSEASEDSGRAGPKRPSAGYDGRKREPLHAGAGHTCLWELVCPASLSSSSKWPWADRQR